MAEWVIIAGLIGGGYLLTKKNQQGVTPPSVTPNAGGVLSPLVPAQPSGPVPKHLLAGAVILTDSQIADMEIALVKYWTYPKTDPPRFKTQALAMLPVEQITVPTNCQTGGNYLGPPLAITATKEGELALSGVGAIGGAAGGTFGSAGGLFGSGFAASGTALGTAIPVAGAVIGIGLSIYNAISAHHAAAVKNEQGLECALLPPANQSLIVIENAVIQGVITIQQGQTALDTLVSDFRRAATNGQSGQLEERPGRLNAMGWYAHFLHAIVIKKQNRYASLVSN